MILSMQHSELIKSKIRVWRDGYDDLIGTTNGVFDILHAGHVQGFRSMKETVARLIVGVNSDGSVKKLLKGIGRPVQPDTSRAIVLAALSYVDMVVIFDEPDPCELLELIQPDIHFKGGDYDIEAMPETEVVRAYGGEVRLVPLVGDYSTTKIINRLVYSHCPTVDSCPVRHGVGAKGFPNFGEESQIDYRGRWHIGIQTEEVKEDGD